ncbi:MAG: winged helix-turn-helix domain-containing protein [Armatimonadota bacterium]
MPWSRGHTTDIVVVTERERQEPMVTLLGQLRRLGFGIHVIPRTTYNFISRVPTPQLVMIDVGSREFQVSGQSPQSVRAAWEYIPVILLARENEVAQIRFGPSLHDFIILPTNPTELDARVRFALWKGQGELAPRDQVSVAGLNLNMTSHEVWIDNRRIDLTYKEFELLKFFMANRRRVFSRTELLDEVWESDYYGGTRTVDVHIRRLRSKLGPKVGNMIQTVRNVGYRFG